MLGSLLFGLNGIIAIVYFFAVKRKMDKAGKSETASEPVKEVSSEEKSE